MSRIEHAVAAHQILRAESAEARAARRRGEEREAWVLGALLFPLFLVVALVRRIAAPSRRAGEPRGIVADARALAGEVIPFVFVR